MLNHAHLLMSDDQNEFAINLYQAAHDKFPDDLQISLYLAKAHFKRKNYSECQKMTTNLLMRHPNDFRLKFNLALCLYNKANEIFSLPVRRVRQTEQAIRDFNVAKSLLTQFIALQSRTNGSPTTFLMSHATSRGELKVHNQAYSEMCHVAESRLTYLNEMLQNSSFYLEHDKKQEETENELRLERERIAEEKRQRELQEASTRKEEEMKKRKEATEKFYEAQKALEADSLDLTKKEKKAKKNPDEPLDGDDLGPKSDDGADYGPAQDDFLGENNNFAGLDDDEENDGDFSAGNEGTGGSGERREMKKRSKKDKSDKKDRKKHKKNKRDKEGRRHRKRHDTGEGLPASEQLADGAEESKQAAPGDNDAEIGQKRKRLVRKTSEAQEDL